MRPYILTYLGHQFDFGRPETSIIDIRDIAHALSQICRFTGHTRFHYSVAQHSVLVSRLVEPKLALAGLLHDAAEAYLGDVSTPLKHMLPDYKLLEYRVERVIVDRFGLSIDMFKACKHADLEMLAREKQDLMEDDEPWALLRAIEPPEFRIRPMEPRQARMVFLHRYRELTGEQVY